MTSAYVYFPPHHQTTWSGCVGCTDWAVRSGYCAPRPRARVDVGRDLGRYGVTCNAISPMVETRLFPGTVDEWRVAQAPGPSRDERAGIGPSPAVSDWEGPGSPDDPENVAPLAVYLSTYASPNVNGYVFGVRRGSIFLYSNPTIERSVHRWGGFDIDAVEADWMGVGF